MSRNLLYLLKHLPDTTVEPTILQLGYGFSKTNLGFRLKSVNSRFYLRIENQKEKEISEKAFSKKWFLTQGRRLRIQRFYLEKPGGTVRLDKYEGKMEGLTLCRIVPRGKLSKPPDILNGIIQWEVTYDRRFKNKNLALLKANQLQKLLQPDYKIVGTIPYILTQKGLQVVLVTARQSGQWIFPKGHKEQGMTDREVALMEAEEEAGIKGKIQQPPILCPFYKGEKAINMMVFPIKVKKLKKSWLEKKQRKRRILSLEKAEKLSSQPAVHSGIRYIQNLFNL